MNSTQYPDVKVQRWINASKHYRALLIRAIDQTQRRTYKGEKVPASEKIVSLFEEHTDVIVKGLREVLYGHKVNLATQENGFITFLNIEEGNPSDSALYQPVLIACLKQFDSMPSTVVADGCYANQANAKAAKALGVKRPVFNKPDGLSYSDMGVKKKTPCYGNTFAQESKVTSRS